MRRSLSQLIDLIEAKARNKAEPRDEIVKLCDDARKSIEVRYEKHDPVREAVMRALETTTIDEDGMVLMDGEYLTTMRLLCKLGLNRSHGNLCKVGKALAALGYVRLARTRIHPQSRWYAPRMMI